MCPKRLRIHWVDPRRILPLHEIRRHADLGELIRRMRKRGWDGRPLLVEVLSGGRHYMSWTGTHRLAAARAAGLKRIPVVYVRGGKRAKGLPLASRTSDDPSRYRILRKQRDTAAMVMRAEIRINAKADALGVL